MSSADLVLQRYDGLFALVRFRKIWQLDPKYNVRQGCGQVGRLEVYDLAVLASDVKSLHTCNLHSHASTMASTESC